VANTSCERRSYCPTTAFPSTSLVRLFDRSLEVCNVERVVALRPRLERGTGTALAALNTSRVAGRGPMTGYHRTLFGPARTDTDRSGCDTRNDILNRDLVTKTFKSGTSGCLVLTRTLRQVRAVRHRPGEGSHPEDLGGLPGPVAAHWGQPDHVHGAAAHRCCHDLQLKAHHRQFGPPRPEGRTPGSPPGRPPRRPGGARTTGARIPSTPGTATPTGTGSCVSS
jgi:hypothetical protein